MNMPSSTLAMYEWKDIPWKEIERDVFKLQKRIFRATQRGNIKVVHRLQRLLIKSNAACLLAGRRVSQDNRGKRTAGVDGVKSLTPRERFLLAQKLQETPFPKKASPVRRIWIPKPGKDEKRPLGIPTMEDRARQALIKLALEPEWEAKFEPHSYGFRPGRSAHDAIKAIRQSLAFHPKYVLDADIAQCFDRINHGALLKKLNTFPRMRETIKRWLKAGIMDNGKLFPSGEGTPQGGVISPLLANIALHGLETAVTEAFPKQPRRNPTTGEKLTGNKSFTWRPLVIRYADDFVILHQDRKALERAKDIAAAWLQGMGLELGADKTRVTNTLRPELGTPGFDFLGFNIRQYRQGKTDTRKVRGKKLDFRTRVKPSKKAFAAHVRDLLQTLRSMRACSQADVIARLNAKISGWTSYHEIGNAREVGKADHVVFQQLKRWARRRHPSLCWGWVSRKYWRRETGSWTFATPNRDAVLASHRRRVVRKLPIRHGASIYDGDWTYWGRRLAQYPNLNPTRAKLLKKQRGKCAFCGLYLRTDSDLVEVDHVISRAHNGSQFFKNKQLLHAHCHDQKVEGHAGSVRAKDQVIEELDEGKPSRPVLKTNVSGD